MCGRYVLVEKTEVIERAFNVTAPFGFSFSPCTNISPGKEGIVITNEAPNQLQLFMFGLTPFWAKKPMYLFNARAEGDYNKDNNPAFTGKKGIISKPAFRKPIRSNRCLVVADAFIEGTTAEGLSKPYLVYLRNRKPFAFAGIWDRWENPMDGNIIHSFSIITTVANSLIQQLPHHRSPVILEKEMEQQWLNGKHLNDITWMLKPYPAEKMNAYPVSGGIKNPHAEGLDLLKPVGSRILPEENTTTAQSLRREGMGRNKAM